MKVDDIRGQAGTEGELGTESEDLLLVRDAESVQLSFRARIARARARGRGTRRGTVGGRKRRTSNSYGILQ